MMFPNNGVGFRILFADNDSNRPCIIDLEKNPNEKFPNTEFIDIHYENFNQFSSNSYCMTPGECIDDKDLNLTIRLMKMRNVLVTPTGMILSGGKFYLSIPRIFRYTEEFFNGTLPITHRFDKTFALMHSGMPVYGHFFIDFMAPLLLFPPEDIQSMHFIINGYIRVYQKEGFKLFNISLSKVHCLDRKTLVYFKTVLLLEPWPHYFYSHIAYTKLYQFLHEKFKLDKNPPTKYYYYNRCRGGRGLVNQKAIIREFRDLYPDISIELMPVYRSMKMNAKIHNSAKLVFQGFHGSGMANLFFMQKGTVYAEIITGLKTDIALRIAKSVGVNYVYSIIGTIEHFNKSNHFIPKNIYLPLLKKAFDCSTNVL